MWEGKKKKKELPDHKAPRRGRRRRKLHLSLETDATGVSVPKEGRWRVKKKRKKSGQNRLSFTHTGHVNVEAKRS